MEKEIKGNGQLEKIGIPKGIKIISYLHWLFGAFCIFFGLTIAPGMSRDSIIQLYSPWFLILGSVLILIGVFSFVVANGFSKRKKWGRIAAIFSSSLIVFTPFLITNTESRNILVLIFTLIVWTIVLYLLFNKSTREYFPHN